MWEVCNILLITTELSIYQTGEKQRYVFKILYKDEFWKERVIQSEKYLDVYLKNYDRELITSDINQATSCSNQLQLCVARVRL